MPDRITLPGVADDDNRTLNRLAENLEAKQPRNFLRASYYDGKHAIRQVGSIIPPHYHRLGLVLGWAGKAVDALARRRNVDTFVWPDGSLGDLGYPEFASANLLSAEISSGIVSSLIHGPTFLVSTRGDESEGEFPGLLHARDAFDATGTWNSRRRRLDDLLSVHDRDDQGRPTALALYLDGLTITAEKHGGVWEVDQREHPWGVPAEVMAYNRRTRRPFGVSRISRPIMSLQDSAVRTLIRLEAHDDIYAIPDLWMFGADESIFKNADGSQKASWQVVMGRIKGLPDDDDAAVPRADVKQFPASSPEPHLASLNAKAKMFAREASLPDTAVAITDMANPTSADSYDAGQHDLISESEDANLNDTPPLRRAVARSLAMANGLSEVPEEWVSLAPKWRNPRFLSRSAEADAGVKQLTAAPWLAETEVGLELLGLSQQQIDRALADRRRLAGRGVLETLQAAAARVTSTQVTGTTGDDTAGA